MTEPQRILVEIADRVATVTLNDPDRRNALDLDLCDRMVAAFDELEAPIHRVSSIDAPQIYCKRMEDQQLPDVNRVVREALKVLA